MFKLMTPAAALAAILALAACGGGGSGGSSSAGSSSAAGSAAGSKTVSVRQLAGVGSVLVDQSGKALSSSDVEASGKIVCSSGACAAFWKPLTLDGGKPTGPAGAKLGMIKRPDGSQQVTANGKPLYTFSEDSPGKATGNNFTDDFDGHHFTWNVVQAGGKAAVGAGGGNAPSHPDSSNYGGGY
jgi:predicted lipoprotein with Yx(FWY)xxD motif